MYRSYLPWGAPPEQKTKPTQHSVAQMRQLGLTPDFIACRGTSPLGEGAKTIISMFTNLTCAFNDAMINTHCVRVMYFVFL